MVFETWKVLAPNFAGTEVTVIDLVGEGEVKPFYVWWESSSTGA